MIGCCRVSCTTVIIIILSLTRSLAQPQLPDIRCYRIQDSVMVSWSCQYDGIKTIAVKKSAYKDYNYATIGYVKQLKKGVQYFLDRKPLSGNVYYKLQITFKSGLDWQSNYCLLKSGNDTSSPIEMTGTKRVDTLPTAKPSKQKSKKDTAHIVSKDINPLPFTIEEQRRYDSAKHRADSLRASMVFALKEDSLLHHLFNADVQRQIDAAKGKGQKTRVVDIDANEMPKQNFTLSPDNDIEADQVCFIKSRYISTDTITGHVHIVLLQEAKEHHYQLKFYNMAHEFVLEVPRVSAPVVILDKRNFQKKGVYRYILKKDGIEMDTGFIKIY